MIGFIFGVVVGFVAYPVLKILLDKLIKKVQE